MRDAFLLAAFCALSCLASATATADDAAPSPREIARQLFWGGKYEESREHYEALRDAAPVEAALGLARIQECTGHRQEADQILAAAIAASPQSAGLLAESARLAFERGDYAVCQERVNAALAIDVAELQARWLAAELHRVAGRLEEADTAYKWSVDYYNDKQDLLTRPEQFRWIGLAATQYARWNRLGDQFQYMVHTLYPDALKVGEDYWPAHVEMARLYLEKYNEAEAGRELKQALAINPNSAEAHAALAELALQQYQLDEARREIDRALELNPELVHARQLRADYHLINFQADEALDALEKARELNPVSEETLARLAAASIVRDGHPGDVKSTPLGNLIDDVEARNSHAGAFYFTLATQLERVQRFPAAERFFREALDVMPQQIGPQAGLGLLQMRLGNEAEARELLEESLEVDPYNLRVSNTLKVLDVLTDYAVLETPHFILKLDRVQDEVLAQAAAKYLEDEVYPELTDRLGYAPPDKTLIEIFHRARQTGGHGWFSARMVGLPYLGTVGACAGKMIAMASPNDMPKKFNWARVLKHEYVHIVNLQQTDFNLPHWFTEGLAVLHEDSPRPAMWDRILLERAASDELFTLDDINLGFVRPNTQADWHLAYCQAELYCEYMLKAHGDDALAKLLAAFKATQNTDAVLRQALGVKKEEFERGYLEFVRGIAANWRPPKADEPEQELSALEAAHQQNPMADDPSARLAAAYLAKKEPDKALPLVDAVLARTPGHPLAALVRARLHVQAKESDQAAAVLERALDRAAADVDVVKLLAELRLQRDDYAGAAELYELGRGTFPYDDSWSKSLAKVYLKSGDNGKLAPVLEELAGRDPDDLLLRKKLAAMAREREDVPAAKRWLTECLQIDVMDADLHRQLGEVLATETNYAAAVDAYQIAVKLNPNEPGVRFALADAFLEDKQPQRARETLQALLKLEPDFPGAAEMLEVIPQ